MAQGTSIPALSSRDEFLEVTKERFNTLIRDINENKPKLRVKYAQANDPKCVSLVCGSCGIKNRQGVNCNGYPLYYITTVKSL